MKVIAKIRKMSLGELAEFLHYSLSSSTCPDCILNNLDKMQFCRGKNCVENIKEYFNSKDSDEKLTYEEWRPL